jgi:hypothetical protein
MLSSIKGKLFKPLDEGNTKIVEMFTGFRNAFQVCTADESNGLSHRRADA